MPNTINAKKFIAVSICLMAVFLLIPSFVSGGLFGQSPNIQANPANDPFGFIDDIIASILVVLWLILPAFAIIMFIMAGGLFLSAQGNPEDIKKAQKAFIWGIVGVIALIISNVLPLLIQNLFFPAGHPGGMLFD